METKTTLVVEATNTRNPLLPPLPLPPSHPQPKTTQREEASNHQSISSSSLSLYAAQPWWRRPAPWRASSTSPSAAARRPRTGAAVSRRRRACSTARRFTRRAARRVAAPRRGGVGSASWRRSRRRRRRRRGSPRCPPSPSRRRRRRRPPRPPPPPARAPRGWRSRSSVQRAVRHQPVGSGGAAAFRWRSSWRAATSAGGRSTARTSSCTEGARLLQHGVPLPRHRQRRVPTGEGPEAPRRRRRRPEGYPQQGLRRPINRGGGDRRIAVLRRRPDLLHHRNRSRLISRKKGRTPRL